MADKKTVRWSAAQMLGDLVVGVGSVGTNSDIIVDTRRVEPENNWQGLSFYIYDGENGARSSNFLNPSFASGSATINVAPPCWVGTHDSGNYGIDAYTINNVSQSVYRVDGYDAVLSQSLPVIGGQTYTATVRYTTAVSGVSSTAGRIEVWDGVQAGVPLMLSTTGTSVLDYANIPGRSGSLYTIYSFSVTFTVADDSNRVTFSIRGSDSGGLYLIDIDLTSTDSIYVDNNIAYWTIASSSTDATSITLSAACARASTNEKYEIHAVPKEDYDRAMSIAFNEIKEVALVTTVATSTLSAQEIDIETDVASGFTHIYRVEIDRGMGWEKVRPNKWTTIAGENTLRFSYDVFSSYQDKNIRINGLKFPTEPSHDMMNYDLPREGHQYLIYRTASLIMPSTPDAFDATQRSRLAGRWEQEAVRLRQALTTTLPANTRRL